MTPGCAMARDIDMPLEANEPARSVAVSMEVRRETSVSRSVPVPAPPTTPYARPKPSHFQSGDGATSHTLSIWVWNPRASSPKKKPLGTGSFSTPAGSATTSTAFLSGERIQDTRSAIPCVPRLTGVTVTTGAACVVSAVVSFFVESTRHPASARVVTRAEDFRKFSDTHQITPAGLRAVECAISAIQKVFSGLDLGLGEISYSNAHREAKRTVLPDFERMRLDLVSQSLRESDGARFARLGNGDHELVAAVAGDRVDATRCARQYKGDFDKYLVSREVA